MLTRRRFTRWMGAAGAAVALPWGKSRAADAAPDGVARVLAAFVDEALPGGGVDRAKSVWQKAGRGAAGEDMFEGGIDPRYLRFEIEALYRMEKRTGEARYGRVADDQVRYLARAVKGSHPTWAIGNALEAIGVAKAFGRPVEGGATVARTLVEAARARSVDVVTADGVKFRHFPCGYGVLGAKDAGWTNDLSMLGSGLVAAYEVTGDRTTLDDAASFAEYFVQPWRKGALGPDGYWRCGTWSEQLKTWVVGPAHFSGFESTDAFGDEAGWVFSTRTCVEFLTRLHRHRPDARYVERCVEAARWTFKACQFDDGAVGMCGRDDKWLGFTGDAITQVSMLRPWVSAGNNEELTRGALKAWRYLSARLPAARVEVHGVDWVKRQTSTDPLVNVGMLWASAVLGSMDGNEMFPADAPRER